MPPARARTPKPDGRRRRVSDGLNQRTPLRLGRRPPLSAAAKCCTKRFASRSGRGCRRGHAGRGASRCASAQHRATHQRRATPAEHLFMLRRYEDENPQQHFRLDVMHTCIGAAYPDAVVSDVRYQSAMKWFRQLEVMKPGDESSGGVLSCARKRSAALARAPACRGRALEAESRSRAREEAGVRGARVRQCGSGGGGSDGSYLCTRHRRDATVSSASMRTPRCEGDCGAFLRSGLAPTTARKKWCPGHVNVTFRRVGFGGCKSVCVVGGFIGWVSTSY